jgi:hypothetical protein
MLDVEQPRGRAAHAKRSTHFTPGTDVTGMAWTDLPDEMLGHTEVLELAPPRAVLGERAGRHTSPRFPRTRSAHRPSTRRRSPPASSPVAGDTRRSRTRTQPAAHESHRELVLVTSDHGAPQRDAFAKYTATFLRRPAPGAASPPRAAVADSLGFGVSPGGADPSPLASRWTRGYARSGSGRTSSSRPICVSAAPLARCSATICTDSALNSALNARRSRWTTFLLDPV